MTDERILQAYFRNIELERMADYAGRGRAYAALSTSKLKWRWLELLRGQVEGRVFGKQMREMHDLEAEAAWRRFCLSEMPVARELIGLLRQQQQQGWPERWAEEKRALRESARHLAEAWRTVVKH